MPGMAETAVGRKGSWWLHWAGMAQAQRRHFAAPATSRATKYKVIEAARALRQGNRLIIRAWGNIGA